MRLIGAMICSLRTELMCFSQSVVSAEEVSLCAGTQGQHVDDAGNLGSLGLSWKVRLRHTSGQRAWLLLSVIFLVTGNQSPGDIEPHSWHCSHHLQFTSNHDSETCFWVASLKRFSVACRVSSRWSASFSEGRDDSEVTGNWFRNKRNSGHLLPVTKCRSLHHQWSGF